jgi:hypothetical protein
VKNVLNVPFIDNASCKMSWFAVILMLLRDAEIVSQIIYSAVTKQKTRCFLTYSKSKQAHAMPFSKTPVPSGADFAEQLLQSDPITHHERVAALCLLQIERELLSILERITAILDEDDEDCGHQHGFDGFRPFTPPSRRFTFPGNDIPSLA